MLWNLRVVRLALLVTVVLVLSLSSAGAAQINGSIWGDRLVGTPADDRIDGGLGNDVLEGRAGADTLLGSFGADRLLGEAGNDTLDGGPDNDELVGGDGNDVASGGLGNDRFEGGAGHDLFDTDTGSDTADGGAGLDLLRSDFGAHSTGGGAGNDVLVSLSSLSLHTQNGDDGNDVVVGWGIVRGGAGNDVLVNNGGTLIDGGPGNDICRRAALTPTVNCETVTTLGANLFAPTLTVTNAPAENAVLTAGTTTVSFTTANMGATYCMLDAGAITPCSGSFTATGISNGDHALAVVAVSGGAQPAKVFVRRFTVNAPVQASSVTAVSSPQPEVLRFETQSLTDVASVRAVFADGGSAVWPIADPKVSSTVVTGGVRVQIADANLAAERVVAIEIRRANTAVIAAWSGDVAVASSVALQAAASPAASTLRIAGENLDRVDSVQLVHAGGSLVVAMNAPGVLRTAGLITITSRALDGLVVSQIDAIRALDGQEIVSSITVDITIAATDDVAPVITLPNPDPIEATGPSGATATFTASATDAVDGPVSVTCTPASGATFPIGTAPVRCDATDAAGNDATATFDVRIVDTIGPQLTLPTAMVVDATGPQGASVEYQPTATDLVDGSVDVVCSPQSGTTLAVGVTVVTCAATDSRGNESTGTFDVTVRDVTKPVLERVDPQDLFEVDSPSGGVVEFDVRANDGVDGDVAVVCNPTSGSSLAIGTHPVHCEAADQAGNVGELDFVVDVRLVTPAVAAERRIERLLPHVFEEGYEVNLPMGRVHSMTSTTRIVLDTADEQGAIKRVVAEGNFGYVDGDGVVRQIDTSLASVPGGFAPRGVAYDVTLPNQYADGVRWGLGDGIGKIGGSAHGWSWRCGERGCRARWRSRAVSAGVAGDGRGRNNHRKRRF